VSTVEGQVYLQRVVVSIGTVGEWREEEAGREDSGGGDVAERRREVEADEEGDRRCRKYGGDRGGNGRVLGGWAIESARPSRAGLGPPTRGDRGCARPQHQGAGEARSKGGWDRMGDEEGGRRKGPKGQGQGDA